MTLARTPRGARSTAIDRVNATTAPFAAQYAAKFMTPDEAGDRTLVDDRPARAHVRRAACVMRYVPLTLTSKQRSQSASSATATEPFESMPALL